jgi:hypothetical protein
MNPFRWLISKLRRKKPRGDSAWFQVGDVRYFRPEDLGLNPDLIKGQGQPGIMIVERVDRNAGMLTIQDKTR